MKQAVSWLSLCIVLISLYVTDLYHLSTSRYNLFLFILLGLVTALVIIIKVCHPRSDQENQNPES
jgi:uncharacterized membrane protein